MSGAQLSSLGPLVAGIAHELNTPLGALNSNHDVLRRALKRLQDILADDVVDVQELDEVRRVVRALDGVMQVNDLAMERMIQLVASLRTFDRPHQTHGDTVDIHEGIDNTIMLLRHQLGDRIQVERSYGDLPKVECFPSELNQVWMNLLVNAVHSMTGPGTISIATQAGPDQVQVTIADTGVGIPADHINRIFQPGFTTKGGRIGMGIGLLIVRQIIDRHSGRIAVRSEPGNGSVFEVTLPLQLPR